MAKIIDYSKVQQSKVRQVAYQEGYKQGKLDTEQKLMSKAENLGKQMYIKGRKDAIFELLKGCGKYICYIDEYSYFEGHVLSIDNLNKLIEQVKEQKND